MSDSGSNSSDLSELQDEVGLRSETGSNDSGAESEPETEAETERLDPSPLKLRDNILAPDGAAEDTDGAATPDIDTRPDAMQPGLTAQDILGEDRPSSDADDDDVRAAAAVTERSPAKSPLELAGKKRKRSGSGSAFANGQAGDGAPLKKRTSSTRNERKSADATKNALGIMRDLHEEAIVSSADEARDAGDGVEDDATGLAFDHNVSNEASRNLGDVDIAGDKQDMAELSDVPGEDEAHVIDAMEEEDAEADAEGEEADAEAEAAAKSEDELAKKRIAMDALVPIEKLFAVFRDRLFDERWAQLSAELAVLNAPDTAHPDYLAMRQALDARREEKLSLEQTTLGYKIKALESKIISHRAQIHGQYFQTVRKVREEYMESLNEQFSRIQRERRQWKTKEPHFIYNFEPKRSKQIAHQTAYNKEVSLLSGIAKHVGFPGAPHIHGATQNDIEDDLRAMNIQPQAKPVSYTARIASSARADEAAAEEQFLEKTPWANPQHPAHQQALALESKTYDPSRVSVVTPSNRMADLQRGAAGSASTIGLNSDPPTGMDQSQGDTIVNGSSPLEQMKRKDFPTADHQQPDANGDKANNSASSQNIGDTGVQSNPSTTKTPPKKSVHPPIDDSAVHQSFETSGIHSNRSTEMYPGNPSFVPRQNIGFGSPDADHHQQPPPPSNLDREGSVPDRDRRQSPPLSAAAASATMDRRFGAPPAAHEGIAANVGVARSFGVR